MKKPRLKQVTSPHNPSIKLVRSLEQRKERKETGLFAAEGAKVVATARDLGWTPRILMVGKEGHNAGILSELLHWAEGKNAECLEVSDDILSKLSTKDNPQSVIGVFGQRWLEKEDIAKIKNGLWIVLEEIRDPGNLGTIIRTADAVGAKGIFLIDNCCDPYARESVRASMGSIFNVPLAKMTRESFLQFARNWKGEIVGTHLAGKADFKRSYKEDVLMVMGSEGPGLSDTLAKVCTLLVKIPMTGAADSLNLSIATALMLYEMKREDL